MHKKEHSLLCTCPFGLGKVIVTRSLSLFFTNVKRRGHHRRWWVVQNSEMKCRYTSKLVRYILLHKIRYISRCSIRYDINPYYSCHKHISNRRYIESLDISKIRQDLYRYKVHCTLYYSSICFPKNAAAT